MISTLVRITLSIMILVYVRSQAGPWIAGSFAASMASAEFIGFTVKQLALKLEVHDRLIHSLLRMNATAPYDKEGSSR